MLAILILALALLSSATAFGQTVVLLIGPPGSGKTTQSKNISKKLKIPEITMSDLLQKEGAKSPLNKALAAPIASGTLVNDEVANGLIAKRIAQKDAQDGFVLDGYPFTEKQAEYLDALLKERGIEVPTVIVLDLPDEIAIERMKERGRVDDTPENMRQRLDEYHTQFNGILKRYAGPLMKRIDGSKTEEQVWQEIEAAL